MNIAIPVFALPTDKPPAPPTQLQAALREMQAQPSGALPGAGSGNPTPQPPNATGMNIMV